MNKHFLIFSIIILVVSCKSKTKFDVDVSDINPEIKVKHFEKDLFKFKIEKADYYVNFYRQEYGEFFKLFNYRITEIGSSEDKTYPENLDMFVRYWKTEGIPEIIDSVFVNFENEQIPDIKEAFKHYIYYFPENTVPEVYTFFSSFGYSVVTVDNIVGLALDKYLGNKYGYLYDRVGWSKYQKRRMIKEMIPVDIMRALAVADFPYNEEDGDNLLKKMIYEGKIQYYLNCMLPDVADTLKWRYTKRQLAWAEKYENKIWSYIAEQKLLFSADSKEIRKMTGDGPYTSVFTDVSAPRAGSFIGYKIVEKYMNNNTVSLKDLMEENDERKILAGAKYNP